VIRVNDDVRTLAPGTVTASASADSWIHQKDSSKNFGTDSILKVSPKSGENTRALVRFNLPTLPAGCQVVGAELQLYSASAKGGRTIEVSRLAATWTESGVTWTNQPARTGTAATAPSLSSSGTMKWSVTTQVQSMYTNGNYGFLIRDAAEGSGDTEQQFHSREKAPDRPPQLVITLK
jgi:large repetitive protein